MERRGRYRTERRYGRGEKANLSKPISGGIDLSARSSFDDDPRGYPLAPAKAGGVVESPSIHAGGTGGRRFSGMFYRDRTIAQAQDEIIYRQAFFTAFLALTGHPPDSSHGLDI